MNLLFRLIWVLLFSRFQAKTELLGPCFSSFMCMPTDLDLLMHMNNGKYFSLLDLARMNLMLRTDLYYKLRANNFYPVVVAETIRFKKSLKLFDSFQIETTVLAWDEKAFILQQRFIRSGDIVADAIVRARFLKKGGGTVSPQEILAIVNYTQASPMLPEWVKQWNDSQK